MSPTLRCTHGDLVADRGAPPGPAFEAVRELRAEAPPDAHGRDLIARATHVPCRRGHEVSGEVCAECAHFLNVVPAGPGAVRIRCAVYETDPVSAVTSTEVPRVGALAGAAEALAAAAAAKTTHVAIVEAGEIVGVASVSELAKRPAVRAAAVAQAPCRVRMDTPIGAVARASHGAGCLVVVDYDEKVLGLITRADLSSVGVPVRP